ncbi:hypothetical protein PAXINDRAFT_164785 [Paxillus involutus ATCC 200175]|uniref:Copper transport protein n=1 Tax=Paxillus involutus ATCC 200175 TaxID=664439 RepID=A0A0C9T117_PAXIN|nr:hypothetical protein PAXINDRAFT_164785 [Paxillus involutus ATCC 200175]
MNSSDATMMADMMISWLHFGGGDSFLFKTWQPSSHGAIAGACVGLLVFCILERWLAAYRRTRELHWKARVIPPFIASHDIPRGFIQAIQSTLSYALMLAVMTFNGAYIICIILGLGIGEILFGRIGRVQGVGLAY